ncbi:hypothetical protein ACWGP3_20565 [Shewanella oncorhynchi]
MALTPIPTLTRSTSMPELSRLGHETLPRNLTRSASLLDVSTPTPCSTEPQNPDVISSAPSMLEAGEPKSISESKPDKRKKSSKKSNKISTEKKAMLHLAAVTGAVTIGAALAPFTLGFSLLPTVFVVMYGNASAMAMYGGSQFVTGEQEKKKTEPKRTASTPTPDTASKHPFPFPPLAALPRPNDSTDTETGNGVERGDTFNNCFNTVNNYHNNWYVFINAPHVPANNLVQEELGHTTSEPSATTTQTTDTSPIELITRPFADAVTVKEMTAHERQARLKILIAGRTQQTDPNLSRLLRSLDQGDDTCAQMVEITGKDGATAYAVIPKGDILVPHCQDRGIQVDGPNGAVTVSTQTDVTDTIVTQTGETDLVATDAIGAQTIKGYNGRKWQVAIPTPVSLTNGAQTGSNYTQGPRHNLNLGPSAGLELASAVIPKGDILVPHGQERGSQVVGTQADGTQTERADDSANRAVTVSTLSMATQTGETDLAATDAIGAETIKGYNGRKWQVAIPTPVSLTSGAQTGSNYTQGPRHNLNLGPSAGLGLASAVIPKGDILVPHGQERGTQVVGTQTEHADDLAYRAVTVSTLSMATQTGETDLAATDAIGAETIKGYNGRKWQVAIPTPVSLTSGAQTGNNYIQGPRHNLNLSPSAGLEQASAVVPKGDILVPHGQERGTQVVGTQTEHADDSANKAVPVSTQTGETHLTATDAIGAQTIKGYNSRKWQVAIPTPESLTSGAQTGSNYTQGPRHNLNLDLSAGLELASAVIPKGDILVPYGQERGTQVVGTQTEHADDSANKAVPVSTQTGETHLTATDAIGAQTIKGYNSRKWQVAIPTPVSLTNGAQTGSNYTQGPRHNLNLDLSAGLELASAVIPKGDILVPHGQERGSQADGTQTERADDLAYRAVTVSTQSMATQTGETDLAPTDAIGAQTIKGYNGQKWQVAIPTPLSLTNGAQTGSNYTQGPRRNLNLGSNAGLDSRLGLASTFDGIEDLSVLQPKGEMSISADQITYEMNIGIGALASVERSEAEIRIIRPQLEIKTPPAATSTIALPAATSTIALPAAPQVVSPTTSAVTSISKATLKEGVLAPQKSAPKPAFDLNKIESRIVGRAGGHIQYKVPKFLDRPEAGTFMGSWRPIPESLQGKRDSVEFAAWRENDLAQYLKSLNTKVLLTQGAVSMRGQNHFAGKMNNVRERAEIKSQLTPIKHMNRADYLQFTGLNSSNGRTHLLETPSGKLRVTPPVTLSNLVLAP